MTRGTTITHGASERESGSKIRVAAYDMNFIVRILVSDDICDL